MSPAALSPGSGAYSPGPVIQEAPATPILPIWVLPADHFSTGSHNSVSLPFGDSGMLMDRNHADVVVPITLSQYF